MKFKLVVFLDEFIGKLWLTFVSFLPPFPKPIAKDAYFKRILIIKFWGIGTIIQATPLFRALKQRYPDAQLDILTFSANKQITESFNLFSNVHVVNLNKGIFILLAQVIKFILSYRNKYSLIIDLEFFANFSASVTKLLNSSYSLGFEGFSSRRNRCYSRTVIFDHSSHVRTIFLKFIDALFEFPRDTNLSIININKDKKISADKKIGVFPPRHINIAININSSELCVNRRWPEDNFRKLIGYLQRDFTNLQIYLVGGNNDATLVRKFHEGLQNRKNIHIIAGILDMLEFSYILSRMDCLITNDSGPVHIAEAVGTPVVCFFGPETPNLYGPLSDNSLVFYKNLFCSPCLNTYNHKKTKCMDNQCLKSISTEEVYQETKKLLLDNRKEKIQTDD